MRIAIINAIIGYCDNRPRALQQRECTAHLISRQTMGWLHADYIVSEGRDALGIPWSIILLTVIKVTSNLNCKSKADFTSPSTCNVCDVKGNGNFKKRQKEVTLQLQWNVDYTCKLIRNKNGLSNWKLYRGKKNILQKIARIMNLSWYDAHCDNKS